MEAVLDVKITYAQGGLQDLILKLDLLGKTEGINKQNLRYIEERCRCRVFAEASWSGVQNGITFTITHPQVSGIQEAEQLLNGILRKVKKELSGYLQTLKVSPDAVTLEHSISSVVCGICKERLVSSLKDFQRHVQSHMFGYSMENTSMRKDASGMQYPQGGGMVGNPPAENNNLSQWQKEAGQSQWSGGDGATLRNEDDDGWRTPSPERNDQDDFTGSFNTYPPQRSRYGMITNPDDGGLQGGNISVPSSTMQQTVTEGGTNMKRRDSVSSETKYGIDGELSRSESRDGDRHKRSRSRSRERPRDPQHSRSRPRSRSRDHLGDRDIMRRRSQSRERERRRSRSGSRSRKRRRSHSRSRSPNSQRKKSRRSGSPDDRKSKERKENERGISQPEAAPSVDPFYRKITDEMIRKPHSMEPKYVALGRKEILMEDRQKGRIVDTQCRALLMELENSLEEKDKISVSKKTKITDIQTASNKELTTKLEILCNFFIERSQKVSASDTNRSYPFAKQLKQKNTTGRFTYGRIFLEAILPEENKIYMQSDLRWIRFPKNTDTIEDCRKRLEKLKEDRRTGRLPSIEIPDLVDDMKSSLPKAGEYLKHFCIKRLEKNRKKLSDASKSDKYETYLFGMCDYIMKKKLGNLKNFMKSDDTAQTNTPSYPEEIKSPKPNESFGTARERWLSFWIDHELGTLTNSEVADLLRTITERLSSDDKSIIERMVNEEYYTRGLGEQRLSEATWIKLKKSCQYLLLKAQGKIPKVESSKEVSEKVNLEKRDIPCKAAPKEETKEVTVSAEKIQKTDLLGKTTEASIKENKTPEVPRETSALPETDSKPHVDATKQEDLANSNEVGKKDTVQISEFTINNNKSISSNEGQSSQLVLEESSKEDKMISQKPPVVPTNGQPELSSGENKPSALQLLETLSAPFTPVLPGTVPDGEKNEAPVPEDESRDWASSPVHDKSMAPEDVVIRFMDFGDEESSKAIKTFAESLNKGIKTPAIIEDDPLEWGSGLYEDENESPLPLHAVLNPHKDETVAIAKGRYKILMAKRNEQKIKDKEIEIILDGLKEDLTEVDRRSLNQIFQQGLQQLRSQQSGNYMAVGPILSVALKLTCFYLIKRAEKLAAESTESYPYWYMLSKADDDTGLTGISRNGQYKEFSTDFAGAEHALNRCITVLAKQNKVTSSRKIDKDLLRGGIHRVALTLGSSIYIKCSKESVAKAKLDVAYEALMQTEYGFAELPGVLVPHAVTDKDTDEVGHKWACMNTTVANRFGPKDWLCRRCGNVNWYHKTKCEKCEVIRTIMQQPVKHVIIRSNDPFKSADVLLQLLADQNKYPKRYKLVEGEFTHTAIMLLGRQKYQGTGYSPKAARRQVDYYALQQTSYNFVSMPPGVIPGNAPVISGDEVPSTMSSAQEGEQMLFQTLPNLILTHPHPKETKRIAQGRCHILMSHREKGKFTDRETVQILDALKRNMAPSDKENLNQMCRDGIRQAKEMMGSQSSQTADITLALKITLNYFLKQATGNEKMETGYPYAHMFSSYKGDSQLPNVSRNGQYCQLDEGFSNNEEKMTQMIVSLGLQNNVKTSFDLIEPQPSVFIAYVTIGQHTYMAESTVSKEDARRAVAMETLMKTEYAFCDLSTELQEFFRPKKPVMSVVVRSSNPLRTARLLTCLMARQNNLKKRYSMLDKGYTYRARLIFGNESYKGYGCTPLLARCMADLYCMQRTCFAFTTDPPGVASDIAGKEHTVIKEEREALMKKRLMNRQDEEKEMIDEMTELITEDLKQNAHITSDEYTLITQKLEKLRALVPETSEWTKYWPWLKVYKHLEYTCDLIQKKSSEPLDQEQWIQQTAEDPDLQKDPQTVIGENEEIEEISIEVTDDDSDQAGEIGDVELDYNDPIILRLFREPHVHEPEYISKGRFEKFMTDRKEGRLKDPQTSIMLIAFKKSLSGFEKNDLEQALNDGVRNIIVNGDELTAKLQIICDFFVKRSKGKKYNPKLYPHAAILKSTLEKPPPGTNIIEALPASSGRSRNKQYITFPMRALDEHDIRGAVSILAAQNKIHWREPKNDGDRELKLKLGDEVHVISSSVPNVLKSLLHNVLLNTNYEFAALPRQLKKFAEAAAADSDSESQFSVPKSDAGGSDSDAEGKKKSSKTNESGIPRLPELEPPDIMTKSAADRYDLFRQRARKIISQREQNSLSDSEVQDILRSVKSKLSEDDERKLKEMLEKQVKKHMKETGQSTSMSWRLTTRLQVTCALVANRLKVAAGDTVQKKDRKDRSRHGSKISYPRDAPFMRKAARLPKCRVKVKRLHLKPGRRYNAAKFMKNLPPNKLKQKDSSEKDRETEKKRKRIVESSSDEEDEKEKKIMKDTKDDKMEVDKEEVVKKEEKMEVDPDEEPVPSKKPKMEVEVKEEKSKVSSTSSSLFDQMMKKETEKKEEKPKASDTASSLFDKMMKKESEKTEDIPDVKKSKSRESSPKLQKTEKVDVKPVVKDLTAKVEKERHKSSSKDDKKAKTTKEELPSFSDMPGPKTKLPWIPYFEPIDLTRRSKEKRYRALRARTREILQQRKSGKLDKKETTALILGARDYIGDEDMDTITELATTALKGVPAHLEGDKHKKKEWKLTQQLQVLCNYLVGRLEKRIPEDIRAKERRKADKEEYQRKAAYLDLREKKGGSSSKEKKDKDSSKSSKHRDSSKDKDSKHRDSSSKHKDKDRSSKHKDGSSKEKKDKDEKYDFPSELPDIPLPWIQALEPTNLMGSPKERYETMKQKVESLRSQRKDLSLDDSDAIQLIKGIKDTLDEDDLKVVNPVILKAVNREPRGSEADLDPKTWKITAQINVLCTYILKRLKQQYLKAEEKRKVTSTASAATADASATNIEVDTKVTAEFSPPSSGPNSPDMDKVKEDIVNIVMTVESDSKESGSDSESVSSISD